MDSYRSQIARLFQRSAFYRAKLQAAGFADAAAVGGLERMSELPFTEKDELRASQGSRPPLGGHAAIEIGEAARI
jgi:phenylacetate-CoA ligase